MAKLYKVEMYILDVNEDYKDLEEILHMTEYKCDASFIPFEVQQIDIEWDDEIDINQSGEPAQTYRKYFKS